MYFPDSIKADDLNAIETVDKATLGENDPSDVAHELIYTAFCTDLYRKDAEHYRESRKLYKLNDLEAETRNASLKQYADLAASPKEAEAAYYLSARTFLGRAAIGRLWDKNRIVYKPDVSFYDRLMSSAAGSTFPASILTALPHDTFYIDTEDISDFKCAGIWVTSFIENNSFIVHHVPVYRRQLEDGGLFHIGEDGMLDTQTTPLDATLGFLSEEDADKEMIRLYGDVYPVRPSYCIPSVIKTDDGESLMRTFVPSEESTYRMRYFVMLLLFYLCTKNCDVKESKATIQRTVHALKVGKVYDGPVEYDVGARFGEVLRYQTEGHKGYGEHISGRKHRSPRVHVRRAHFHHYHCGKGGRDIELRFISEIVVNGKAQDLSAVIHQMTDKEPKGSRGEDLIRNYLSSHGYKYEKEYYVAPIRARYDFSVTDDNGEQRMIEFDGEQHFHPVDKWGGITALREGQTKDKIKTLWCRSRKIPLLRIRYDEKHIIPELLQEFLSGKCNRNSHLTEEEYYSVSE